MWSPARLHFGKLWQKSGTPLSACVFFLFFCTDGKAFSQNTVQSSICTVAEVQFQHCWNFSYNGFYLYLFCGCAARWRLDLYKLNRKLTWETQIKSEWILMDWETCFTLWGPIHYLCWEVHKGEYWSWSFVAPFLRFKTWHEYFNKGKSMWCKQNY